MLPAITPLVALSVPVMLALGEMESTAQVRHTPVLDRITVMVISIDVGFSCRNSAIYSLIPTDMHAHSWTQVLVTTA